MRVLYIHTRQGGGGWLAEAFAADSASKVVLEEAVGTAAGLARLRDEVFDAVLVSHEPGELDALDLVEGYRAGGAEEPIVVLGAQSEPEMAALCYEVGADGYVCVGTTTRNLIWVVARAVQRRQLVCENQRLSLGEQTRRRREQDEAADALEQQRALLGDPSEASPAPSLPTELVAHYRELLRTYVIMGSGNLADELGRLAELLVAAGLNARHTLQLHLHVLGELVHGLGTRSTRHVMIRADLLALELLLNLADGYRRRYQEHLHPPVQQLLPGF
jgi:DNA-binding NarL/FixJ family response regulator